jgi:hypothetical protein
VERLDPKPLFFAAEVDSEETASGIDHAEICPFVVSVIAVR